MSVGFEHNTAQNGSINLPSYPPDNRHCSDAVYWSRGEVGRRRKWKGGDETGEVE